jgi:hypothetical protein
MTINPKNAAVIDSQGELVELGDTVCLEALGRDYPGVVVHIIRGWHSSNCEIEYPNGFREEAFGADVRRLG